MPAHAVFFEQDDARAVAKRLARDGFAATVRREPNALEDDDQDHAWSVTTDAPEVMLELLAEDHDGWVDHDRPAPTDPVEPVVLPTAPRRRHVGD